MSKINELDMESKAHEQPPVAPVRPLRPKRPVDPLASLDPVNSELPADNATTLFTSVETHTVAATLILCYRTVLRLHFRFLKRSHQG